MRGPGRGVGEAGWTRAEGTHVSGLGGPLDADRAHVGAAGAA